MGLDDSSDSVFEFESESHDTGFLSQRCFEESCRLLLRYGQDKYLEGLRFGIRGEVRLLAINNVPLNEPTPKVSSILVEVLHSVIYVVWKSTVSISLCCYSLQCLDQRRLRLLPDLLAAFQKDPINSIVLLDRAGVNSTIMFANVLNCNPIWDYRNVQSSKVHTYFTIPNPIL